MLNIDRQNLLDIFSSAIAAVDPYRAVLQAVKIEFSKLYVGSETYDLESFERIIVIGAGKATARMALAVEVLLKGKIDCGLIIIKNGHAEPLSIVEQVESSHPVPAEAGMSGTRRLLEMVRAADEKTLVICLLSGGASALLLAPVDGISLHDKQEVTQLLLNAGASINELNAVRKHLSSVKGGGLAQAAHPARMFALIMSDVIGDPLDVIASGPTVADSSTFADAWKVMLRYRLTEKLPPRVAAYLQRGMAGEAPETVKQNNPCLTTVQNVTIASIRQALLAAQENASQLGYETRIVTDQLHGEARDAAGFLAQVARDELVSMKPNEKRCLLCGGETTVTVRGGGVGGRNQELALAFALEIDGLQGVSLLSAGTDGTDGPNEAAGAMVDGTTVSQAQGAGIDTFSYLVNNDSYHFFQQFDAVTGAHSHLITGPTGTNVMDIQIMLLSNEQP